MVGLARGIGWGSPLAICSPRLPIAQPSIYIYIGRVYFIGSYKIGYFVATSIYDNFIY
jgi:hypothetical protein